MKVSVLSAAAVTAALLLASSAGAKSVDWHDGKPSTAYEHPSEKHWDYTQKKAHVLAMVRSFMEKKYETKTSHSVMPPVVVFEPGNGSNGGNGGVELPGAESVSAVPVPAAGLLLLAGLGGLAMVRRKS